MVVEELDRGEDGDGGGGEARVWTAAAGCGARNGGHWASLFDRDGVCIGNYILAHRWYTV